jgi:hypothetical protein
MRSSLSLALCLTLLAGAAQAQDLNVITGVEVKAEGNFVLVTVKGSKPPNFTTFSMADPARFVIDFSEARFQGVPEDVRVDDGVIRVVKNLAYGAGATAIARVMLAFSVDVEPPDVQTDGTSLVVKVFKPGAAAVAATPAGAGAAPVTAAAADADAAAKATAAKAEADEAARQEALARDRREAEAREQARMAAEATTKEREAQARADAEARTREAEKVAAEQAAADEAARVAAEARRAEIKAKVAAGEGQPVKLQEEPVAAAEAKPTADEVAAAEQAKADSRAQREIDQALATQQAAQQAADARAADARAADARAADARAADARAAAPPALAAPTTRPLAQVTEVPPAPARPAKLQAVGFQQLPTVSRVFVKTSVTPRFTITDVGDDVVRLEVENTRSSRRNDTRPLDTSFFPSAVAMITPSKQGTSYVVDIKLRKRVPYQQKLEGDVLAIDFERPAVAATGGGEAGTTGQPAAATTGEGRQDNQQGIIVAPEEKAGEAAPDDDAEPAAEPPAKQ